MSLLKSKTAEVKSSKTSKNKSSKTFAKLSNEELKSIIGGVEDMAIDAIGKKIKG